MPPTVLTAQVNRFLKDQATKVRKTTHETYTDHLTRVLMRWCDGAGIEDARDIDLQSWIRLIAHLESNDKKLSPESVRTYLRSIKVFLNWAGVSTRTFPMPQPKKPYLEPLSRAHYEAMLGHATEGRDRLILQVLWGTGIFTGELLQLRPSDLIEPQPGKTHLRVKGRGGLRRVPIDPSLFNDLQHHAGAGSTKPIFTSKNRAGRELTRSGVDRVIRQLASRARVSRQSLGPGSGVSPLLLRQSYAIRWLKGGGSPIDLMTVLGHNSLDMVSNLYALVTKSDPFDEMMRLRLSGDL